ncbi:GatB/YqeY domain-containing protein [Legionella sp. 16cNR16C]|uniref:GatB/YqeY domain-containing protein n=1 Tax=Legionella sp. 16cNR16C TaxID=2905656 RepID=UPI001E37841E|nr:GatB/YqeY domain-containing protein [Legionella sp. 16cNR16C]MCE3045684.1 GatB/YqeY domain-containing protein [Legionella sp. 16cNR16C]
MSIKDRISNDLKDAMRARDKQQLETLRLITAAIKQVEVDERIDVDDARLLVILDKLAKQRKESISQFTSAGRTDLVAQEEYELGIIGKYLPEPLSDEEVMTLVTQAIAELDAEKMSDMGKVMAHLKPMLQGRADMSQVSAIIKAKLS